MRAIVWAVALTLALPLTATLALEVRHAELRAYPLADLAVIDLAARDALALERALGPYSRHGWSHPGPLYFYVLAAALAVAGRGPAVLPIWVALLSFAVLAALLVRALRRPRHPLGAAFALAGLAVFLLALRDVFPPSFFSARWNPIVPILPYLLLWLLLGDVAGGRWRALPLVVALHAFVSQTHVGNVLPATLGLVLAFSLGARRAPPPRLPLILGGAVAAALWGLPLLAGSDNLVRLVTFFVRGGGRPAEDPSWLAIVAEQTQRIWVIHLPRELADLLAPSLFGVQLLALALALGGPLPDARARRARARRALALAHLLVAVVAAQFLDRTGWWHSTLWMIVAGALGWAELLALGASSWGATRRRLATAGALAVAPALMLGYAAWLPGSYERWAVQRRIDQPILRSLERAAGLALAGGADGVSVPAWAAADRSHEYWTWLTGLVLARADRGERPPVDEALRFMLDGDHAYLVPSPQTLELAPPGRGDRPVLAGDGPVRLYGPLDRSLPPPVPLSPAPLVELGRHGVEGPGDPRLLSSAGGETWTFHAEDAALLFATPMRVLRGVELEADAEDAFVLEGGCAPDAWSVLAELPAGTAQRTIPLAARVCALRLRRRDGGADEVGRVRRFAVQAGADTLRIVHAPEGVDPLTALSAEVEEGAPLDSIPGRICLTTPDASLELEAPSAPTRALVITATADAELAVEGALAEGAWTRISHLAWDRGGGARTRLAHLDPAVPSARLRLRTASPSSPACVVAVRPLEGPGWALTLGDAWASTPHLGAGWSPVEEAPDGRRWRWTTSRDATLRVPHLPAGAYDVVVEVGPHSTHARSQGLVLAVNRRWGSELELREGFHVYRVPVELPTSGPVDLDLRSRWAGPPAGTSDTRTLGVAVTRVALLPRPAW